mmetsp:Transcript_46787/g.130287  ORF Transcript_46787/g.130287 Transcript_46787/m.130287 type:complete len:255 (+) Transcript_46787:1662-2426(+)
MPSRRTERRRRQGKTCAVAMDTIELRASASWRRLGRRQSARGAQQRWLPLRLQRARGRGTALPMPRAACTCCLRCVTAQKPYRRVVGLGTARRSSAKRLVWCFRGGGADGRRVALRCIGHGGILPEQARMPNAVLPAKNHGRRRWQLAVHAAVRVDDRDASGSIYWTTRRTTAGCSRGHTGAVPFGNDVLAEKLVAAVLGEQRNSCLRRRVVPREVQAPILRRVHHLTIDKYLLLPGDPAVEQLHPRLARLTGK